MWSNLPGALQMFKDSTVYACTGIGGCLGLGLMIIAGGAPNEVIMGAALCALLGAISGFVAVTAMRSRGTWGPVSVNLDKRDPPAAFTMVGSPTAIYVEMMDQVGFVGVEIDKETAERIVSVAQQAIREHAEGKKGAGRGR
jgi:hypothetical protein